MDAISLCRRLIRARTVLGNEGEAVDVAEDAMRALGFDEVWRDEPGNLIGTLHGELPGTVLFDGHLDVVDAGDVARWRCDPFGGELIDGRLYGRGAVDMKGPVAAMIAGIAAIRGRPKEARRTIYVSCSLVEELVEGLALREVLERLKPDAVVIGEPTNGRLAIAQRGRGEILIEAVGKAAHSAYPHEGVNAAEAIADLIIALRAMPAPTDDILEPGYHVLTEIWSEPRPSGSTVPYYAGAAYDRRLLPGETPESVLAPIRAAAQRLKASETRETPTSAEYRISIVRSKITTYRGVTLVGDRFAPGWKLGRNHPIVEAALSGLRAAGQPGEPIAYATCTNGSASAGWYGIPTIGYGPGVNERSHGVDEYIAVDELTAGVSGYTALAWAVATAPSLPRLPGVDGVAKTT
ncbi:MAG TPA: YgeY family selenium metabolism-linked hydrolase [bacterium]|nr:YgeY family selenium metabolism-linked hydrolase [bacterium]